MFFMKYMLLVVGSGMLLTAGALLLNDMWLVAQYRRKLAVGILALEPQPVRWRTTVLLVCLAWAPLLIGFSLVIPSSNSHVPHPPRVANVEYPVTSATLPH